MKFPINFIFFTCVFLTALDIKDVHTFVSFNDVIDVVSVTKDVVVWIAKAWKFVDSEIEFDVTPPFLDRTEKKLFFKVNKINSVLNELSKKVDATGATSTTVILRNLPERLRLELRLNELLSDLAKINIYHDKMSVYVEDRAAFEKKTLQNFADAIVSHTVDSVGHTLEKIYLYVVPLGKGIIDTGILDSLGRILKQWPYDLDHGLEFLEGIWSYAYIYSDLRGIYALYQSFRRFQPMQTGPKRIPSPKQAWLDLTRAILDDQKNGVNESLFRIHETVRKTRLFTQVKKEIEGDMLCNVDQSPQQVLYSLYNAIALTELKGYMMVQFSYMLKKLYGEGNYTKEAELARNDYFKRTTNIVDVVQKAMSESSRELWRCDPKRHIEGETYVEVTQLLQGYIQNEVDLNPDGTCRENCAEYTYTKSHGCFKNLYCQQQRRCNGKIINCRFVDADMWVCPAADPNGNRRYEYIEYENGRILGRKQSCRRGTTKVDSWWRWLFWHCSYCFCLCDEQGRFSDRYVNLRAAVANTEENKVVTGLRFVKRNRIIHLQVQEAKLLSRGNIDNTTIRWVPVDDYRIIDKNVFNGKDYHTFSWEKRAIDLDDLVADEGHVLTGVRFKMIGSHLNFEILVTPFDFETGRLIDPKTKSIYKDNPNTDSSLKNPRTRVRLENPDIPTRSLSPSVPDSKTDQYVELTHTDFDRDAAQTTVPFFDAQMVQSTVQAVPLSGAGIYHKGRNNFGGFIAPKVITYDFSKHLKNAFPEDDPQIN